MPTILFSELLEELRKIDTPTICNAIEAFRVRPRTLGYMGMDIRSLFPELGVMVGYAVTATVDSMTTSRVHDMEKRFQFYEAIQKSPKPVVLVLKDVGPRQSHSCHFGEMLANTTHRLGAIGLVTDGGVRDVDAVQKLGFHYFAPGTVPSHGNFGFVEVNVPVVVSETPLLPGDIVHGDANGVTVIPAEIADKVVQQAQKVMARESEMLGYIRSNDFTLDGLRSRFLRTG